MTLHRRGCVHGADVVATACPLLPDARLRVGHIRRICSSDATDRGTEGTSTPTRGKLPEVRDVAARCSRVRAVKRGQ